MFKDMGYEDRDKNALQMLLNAFIEGLRAPLAAAVKKSRPEWRTMQLSDLIKVAKGAEQDMKPVRVSAIQPLPHGGGRGRGNNWRGRGRGGGTARPPPTCWNCGETGHVQMHCQNPKSQRTNDQSTNSSTLLPPLQSQ